MPIFFKHNFLGLFDNFLISSPDRKRENVQFWTYFLDNSFGGAFGVIFMQFWRCFWGHVYTVLEIFGGHYYKGLEVFSGHVYAVLELF